MPAEQQQPGHRSSVGTGDSDIEEIPRPPEPQHTIQLPPMPVNVSPWQHFLAFFTLAVFDLAMNAAAGATATTVGARLNRKPLTAQVLRVGTLAAMTKSAITSFREMIMMGRMNFYFRVLLLLIFSSFGICLIITAEVSNSVLNKTPKELLVAAVVAAVPLFPECLRGLIPIPDEEGNYFTRPVIAIFLIASDSLGGYVFARMASNQNMPISSYHAACSSGAAFGTITFLARAITACTTCIKVQNPDRIVSFFGTYKFIKPEPIVISDSEYQKTVEAGRQALISLISRAERIRNLMLRLGARLAYFVPISRVDKRKIQGYLRERAAAPSFALTDMRNEVAAIDTVANRFPA